MTTDDLARFRAGFASCELILLADVSTGTVLAADSAVRLGQEHLDALCDIAVGLFGPSAPLPARLAVHAGPTGCRVFLRGPVEADEALCGLFAPGADLTGIEAAASALFAGSQV